jgi:hypothetical protein
MKFSTLSLCAFLIATPAIAQSNQHLPISQTNVVKGPSTDSSYIIGTMTNETGKDISSISLTFKLYDAKGVVVGNAIANMSDFSTNDKWSFKALATVPFSKYVESGIITVPQIK